MQHKIFLFLFIIGLYATACQKQDPNDYRGLFVVGTYYGNITEYEGQRYMDPQLPIIFYNDTTYPGTLTIYKGSEDDEVEVEVVLGNYTSISSVTLDTTSVSFQYNSADYYFDYSYGSYGYETYIDLACFTDNDSIFFDRHTSESIYSTSPGSWRYNGFKFSGFKQ